MLHAISIQNENTLNITRKRNPRKNKKNDRPDKSERQNQFCSEFPIKSVLFRFTTVNVAVSTLYPSNMFNWSISVKVIVRDSWLYIHLFFGPTEAQENG